MNKHYWSMTFQENLPAGDGWKTANCRIGWNEYYITESRIQEAKTAAGVSQDACTLSINYIGAMSPEIAES